MIHITIDPKFAKLLVWCLALPGPAGFTRWSIFLSTLGCDLFAELRM